MYLAYYELPKVQPLVAQIGRMKRLAEIVHRAIPYPLFIVFVCDTTFSFSLAYKRFSQAEKDAIVAENFQATGWLDLSNPTENQAAFLENLDISTWPHTHFLAFYKAAMDRIIALACAEYTGHYSLDIPHGLSVDERVIKLDQLGKFQQEKLELAGKLKKEKNLGTQVELNTEIRKITTRIKRIKRKL